MTTTTTMMSGREEMELLLPLYPAGVVAQYCGRVTSASHSSTPGPLI
jgi:hypothetical protein